METIEFLKFRIKECQDTIHDTTQFLSKLVEEIVELMNKINSFEEKLNEYEDPIISTLLPRMDQKNSFATGFSIGATYVVKALLQNINDLENALKKIPDNHEILEELGSRYFNEILKARKIKYEELKGK